MTSLCLRRSMRLICSSSRNRSTCIASASSLTRSFASQASTPTYKLPSSISSDTKIAHHQHSRHLPAALSQVSSAIVDHAKGSYIYTTASNGKPQRKLLDFTSGIGVTNLGHCHPRVESAIKSQTEKGVHLQLNCVTHQPVLDLAAKFSEILPPHLAKDYQMLFSNSGAEAVENAVKLARSSTKRQSIIVFQGSFHGRTIGAGSLTTAKHCYRAHFQPAMSGVFVVPFPYCHRCPVSQHSVDANGKRKFNTSNCCHSPIEQLRLLLKQQTSPDEVAAILVEPVLGEGGYVVPPADFFPQLRRIADEIGCLLISDEVQSGFGRTGSMFASTQLGMVPDILITAKGIANGSVLSAIIAPSRIMSTAGPGSLGGTFGGNPIACAAAVAVIETFQKDAILDNVKARSDQLFTALRSLHKQYPKHIGDVRGLGLMIAIEFTDNVKTGFASRISKECEKRDLLVMTAGAYEALRFIPPLTISKQEMNDAIKVIQTVIEHVIKAEK